MTTALATSQALQSEILPVRRDWAAVQLSYLESLRAVMQAWAEVRLFARSE